MSMFSEPPQELEIFLEVETGAEPRGLTILKGLCSGAQGCEERATLGKEAKSSQPRRVLWPLASRWMPPSFSVLLFHLVFSTKGRLPSLSRSMGRGQTVTFKLGQDNAALFLRGPQPPLGVHRHPQLGRHPRRSHRGAIRITRSYHSYQQL